MMRRNWRSCDPRATLRSIILHNRLQLPSVAQRILNHHVTTAHDIVIRRKHLLLLLWEVYPPIFRKPAT